MDLPPGFTLTPLALGTRTAFQDFGQREPPNTSEARVVKCEDSVCSMRLFCKQHASPAGTVPGQHTSHKCRHDTGRPDADSREQQFRNKQSSPCPDGGRPCLPPGCLGISRGCAGLSGERHPAPGSLPPGGAWKGSPHARHPATLSFLRKDSHLRFLQRHSMKAPSHG